MIVVEVKAEVTYACWLSDEDSEKVKKFAEENEMELVEAAEYLYFNTDSNDKNHINLYANSTESDFSTEEFVSAEEEEE